MDNAVAMTLNSADGAIYPMTTSQRWTIYLMIWVCLYGLVKIYLGEPTPYYSYWPSRSSYFGAVDLAGITQRPLLSLQECVEQKRANTSPIASLELEGREGETTPVYCYTSYPSAELFVNGKSMGRIHKQANTQLDRYRLRWNDVKYAPGEIKVVAYDENGKQVAEKTIRTAGQPAVLDMKEERSVIASDGEDLAYITLSMLDKDGNECPTANQSISFTR